MHSQVQKARDFAVKMHADQMYGEVPYIFHIDQVVHYLKAHYAAVGEEPLDSVLVAGYLHDVLEDTEATEQMLLAEGFPLDHINLVFNLTDEPGKNRKARKRNTWHKIRRDPRSVLIKIADRIANTAMAAADNPRKFAMYVKEFPLFEAALYVPGQYEDLWEKLAELTFPDVDACVVAV